MDTSVQICSLQNEWYIYSLLWSLAEAALEHVVMEEVRMDWVEVHHVHHDCVWYVKVLQLLEELQRFVGWGFIRICFFHTTVQINCVALASCEPHIEELPSMMLG